GAVGELRHRRGMTIAELDARRRGLAQARECHGLRKSIAGGLFPMKLRDVSRRVSGRSGRRAGVTQAGPLVIGIIVALAPIFSGCASRSPAEAENREIRLTQDGVVKYSPRLSPDGAWIAYSAVTSQGNGAVAVYVLPR